MGKTFHCWRQYGHQSTSLQLTYNLQEQAPAKEEKMALTNRTLILFKYFWEATDEAHPVSLGIGVLGTQGLLPLRYGLRLLRRHKGRYPLLRGQQGEKQE